MPTPAQIKKIHAIKGALKMDDETYRLVLSGYGVKSSTMLSITKADELLQDLEGKAVAAGTWEKRKAPKKAKSTRRLADDSQSKMLRALWIQLHQAGKVTNPAESALRAFVKRMTKKDALEWLNDRDVTIVKKALKDWLAREEVKSC